MSNIFLTSRIADQGHEVVGLEEVEQPILEFFKDQQLDYTKGYTKDGLEYFEVFMVKVLKID